MLIFLNILMQKIVSLFTVIFFPKNAENVLTVSQEENQQVEENINRQDAQQLEDEIERAHAADPKDRKFTKLKNYTK